MSEQQTASDGLPFDPDSFMQVTVDSPMATERQICPEGSFTAMVADFDSTAFEKFDFTYNKGPNAGQPGSMTKFNCPFTITDAKVLADMERDSLKIFQQITLDLAPNGGLAVGKDKNVDLGKLREAVDQNTGGPWTFANLKGAGPLLVQVRHETYKRKDGTEATTARVVRTAKIR